MIHCPKCNSVEFFYVQDSTEYYSVESIDAEDKNVELGSLYNSSPADTFHFSCEACNWTGGTDDYYKELASKTPPD